MISSSVVIRAHKISRTHKHGIAISSGSGGRSSRIYSRSLSEAGKLPRLSIGAVVLRTVRSG